MKKIIITITAMCLILTQFTGYCKAERVNHTVEIVQQGQLSFYYEGQEKRYYKMLKTGDNMIYLVDKTNTIDTTLTQEELYHNELYEKILEYGYPNKSLSQLGANNEFEAYVATQEAMYYFIENRNLDLYHAENEEGQRIIDIITKIVVRVEDKDVNLIEQTQEWKEYEDDPSKHYKEYKVELKKEIINATIQAIDAKQCELLSKEAQPITNIKNNDIVKVVVPKNIDQVFPLQIDYNIMQPIIYIGRNPSSQTQYLITRLYSQDKDYQIQVNSQSLVDIHINNYQYDTKNPIFNNQFEILDENKNSYIAMLTTNEEGSINISLKKGKYYLKQVMTSYGELQKELVPIEVKGNEKTIELNVYNMQLTTQEQTIKEKQVNVTEENKVIQENHVTEVMNVHTTNLQKEIVDQTNETNLHQVNHFINTITKKNLLNLSKENYYRNQIQEQFEKNQILEGETRQLQMNQEDYKNYMDSIKVGTIDIPNLPMASKE
ncbi:MAG: Cys-Gln thioester bond-forming surface protein [Clostridia bacterium]|nr:Cys-Gln thioester bond-forming surface protein [Clostridia bacterium]